MRLNRKVLGLIILRNAAGSCNLTFLSINKKVKQFLQFIVNTLITRDDSFPSSDQLNKGKDCELLLSSSCPGQCGPLSFVEECRGSALIGRELHSVATPALLCHKEPAHRIQSPLLGALERKIPPLGGILLAPRWFFMA